jgi:primosomal protein N' (replication factor Y) (superfamily II helicase)
LLLRGYVSLCPHCQLPVTFHGDKLKLICHHCGYHAAPPSVCPDCSAQAFRFLGGGTQRVEAEVKQLFPEARITRLDKDTATPKFLNQTHADLHAGKVDILIGTQMIAKGLNLPLMDTVGIVLADSMLYLPDFTAAERTFQLISQVSGRTGRSGAPGKVIIQTYSPDHPAIVAASKGDFTTFTAAELEQRKLLKYPPFVYLLKISLASKTAEKAAADLKSLSQSLKLGVEPLIILGPAPAYREQFGGKFHWQLILKSPRRSVLLEAAKLVPSSWTVDPDPVNLL